VQFGEASSDKTPCPSRRGATELPVTWQAVTQHARASGRPAWQPGGTWSPWHGQLELFEDRSAGLKDSPPAHAYRLANDSDESRLSLPGRRMSERPDHGAPGGAFLRMLIPEHCPTPPCKGSASLTTRKQGSAGFTRTWSRSRCHQGRHKPMTNDIDNI
jgi:hypothetical protein